MRNKTITFATFPWTGGQMKKKMKIGLTFRNFFVSSSVILYREKNQKKTISLIKKKYLYETMNGEKNYTTANIHHYHVHIYMFVVHSCIICKMYKCNKCMHTFVIKTFPNQMNQYICCHNSFDFRILCVCVRYRYELILNQW